MPCNRGTTPMNGHGRRYPASSVSGRRRRAEALASVRRSNWTCGCRDRSAAHVALGSGGLPTAFDVVLSRRLPWLMAPQAPLRSRTVGFPESGSDLGSARHFPGAGLPRPLKAQAMARIHPQSASLAGPLAPRPKFTAVPGSVSGAVWVVGTAECPGPLSLTGALPTPGRSLGPPRGTLLPLPSSYGPMRQSHHLSPLSVALGVESPQVAAIPCWS